MKNKIKVLRSEKDCSQAELAKYIDVSRQAINAIVRGKHNPSLRLSFSISKIFEQRIEEFFS